MDELPTQNEQRNIRKASVPCTTTMTGGTTAAGSKGEKWDKGTRNERTRDNNFPERDSAESGVLDRSSGPTRYKQGATITIRMDRDVLTDSLRFGKKLIDEKPLKIAGKVLPTNWCQLMGVSVQRVTRTRVEKHKLNLDAAGAQTWFLLVASSHQAG